MGGAQVTAPTMTLQDAERAWRAGRTAGLAALWALPVLVVAAWLLVGAWTLFVTVPGGPWLVLSTMWSVEHVAGRWLARTPAAVTSPQVAIAVEATAPTAAAA